MRRIMALVLVLLVGTLAFACSSSDSDKNSNPGSGLPNVTAVFGKVVATTGAALPNVSVSGGGVQTATGADGKFQLDAAAAEAVVLGFELAGHVRSVRRVDVLEGTPTALEVTLIAEAAAVDLDSDAGGSSAGSRNASITAPAAAFSKAGAAVTGMVQVHLTPFDPATPAELAAYPGDLVATTTGGQSTQLDTFGVLDITVRQNGEELEIASGKSIDIRIPAPSSGETPPASVGLWSFDPSKGVWVEEGTATYNATDKVYEASITHLSPWNADQPQNSTCLRGRAVDSNGNAIPGAYVTATGIDYLGFATANAKDSGEFCVMVRQGSKNRVVVIHPLGGGAIREIDAGSAPATLPLSCDACSDEGDWVIKVGSVGDVDCENLQNPFAGTCAEGWMKIFECYAPSGTCTYNTQTGETVYANGAKSVSSISGGEFMGPGGQQCGGYTIDLGTASFAWHDPQGQTWIQEQQGDNFVVKCDNGQSVVLTGQQQSVAQACGGTNPTAECELIGGGPGLTPCKTTSECAGGWICCPSIGYCVPDVPDACPQP